MSTSDAAFARLERIATDVYFTHTYVAEANGEGHTECFAFHTGDASLYVPGVLMPIPGLALVADRVVCGPHFDLQTSNGYGGPIVRGAFTPDRLAVSWAT